MSFAFSGLPSEMPKLIEGGRFMVIPTAALGCSLLKLCEEGLDLCQLSNVVLANPW